jgi:hypothetical protein
MHLICACVYSLVSSGYASTGGETAREENGYTVEHSGTQFTCFTSTRVRILTGDEGAREEGGYTVENSGSHFTCCLLALPVHEYEY